MHPISRSFTRPLTHSLPALAHSITQQVRKQLRELKKVLKLLKRAGEQLDKGYNNKAFEYIDECTMTSRSIGSPISPLASTNAITAVPCRVVYTSLLDIPC